MTTRRGMAVKHRPSQYDPPKTPVQSSFVDILTLLRRFLPPRACSAGPTRSGPRTSSRPSRDRLLRDELSSAPSPDHPLCSVPSVRDDSAAWEQETVDTFRSVVDGGAGEGGGVVSESNEVGQEHRRDEGGCEAGVRVGRAGEVWYEVASSLIGARKEVGHG